jgi:hypothetical protein
VFTSIIVVLGLDPNPPRAAEYRQLRIAQLETRGGLKEFRVLGVRTGPSPFDVVDAKLVQLLSYVQFVHHRERDALTLGAVSKRSVVEINFGQVFSAPQIADRSPP